MRRPWKTSSPIVSSAAPTASKRSTARRSLSGSGEPNAATRSSCEVSCTASTRASRSYILPLLPKASTTCSLSEGGSLPETCRVRAAESGRDDERRRGRTATVADRHQRADTERQRLALIVGFGHTLTLMDPPCHSNAPKA